MRQPPGLDIGDDSRPGPAQRQMDPSTLAI